MKKLLYSILLVAVCSTTKAATTTQITQRGITFQFASPVEVGQFANGDWWVVGPATITSMSPASSNGENGWQVNPTVFIHQGYDHRARNYDPSLVPSLPYTAQANTTVIKARSRTNLPQFPRTWIEDYMVVTFLATVPPDSGATVFRPPYAGNDKPLYSINDINTNLLPSLPPVANTPSLNELHAKAVIPKIEHLRGWAGESIHPNARGDSYGAGVARQNGVEAIRLMLDDPIAEKMDLLIAFMQNGYDTYHLAKEGMYWEDDGGHAHGRKLPIVFTGWITNNQEITDFVSSRGTSTFGENFSVYESSVTGEILYGQYEIPTDPTENAAYERDYWYNQLNPGNGRRTLRDPYQYIDGGERDGGGYARCCFSQPVKHNITPVLLLCGMEDVWNDQVLLDYIDRWVEVGTITQPDPCAPADPADVGIPSQNLPNSGNYGVTYGPDGNGGCIVDQNPSDGIGRSPNTHNQYADDGLWGNPFADDFWDAYRQYGDPISYTPSPNVSVALGQSTTLTLSGVDLTKVEISWNEGAFGNDTSFSLTPTTNTTVIVDLKYKNDLGCMVSHEFEVDIQSTPPGIIQQPNSSAVCETEDTTFTIEAAGPNLAYQWQVDVGNGFSNISNNATYGGAQTNELHINGVTTNMASYLFQCLVSNQSGSITSNSATLSVIERPNITNQPSAQQTCESGTANFTVTATGDNLTYQWQVNDGAGFVNLSNNTNYAGTNTNQLQVSNVENTLNNHQFRCVVENTCESVNSAAATLSVSEAPVITNQPNDTTICSNNTATFSISATGNNLTYQWQVNNGNGNGFVNFAGATSAILSVPNVTEQFNNFLIRCIVSNNCGSSTSNHVNLTVSSAPEITSHPTDTTICSGEGTAFSVTASGDNIGYQWQIDYGNGFTNFVGATDSIFQVSEVLEVYDGYHVRCAVVNGCGVTYSNVATQYVNPLTEIVVHPTDTAACEEDATEFSVVAKGKNLTYQWQVNDGEGFVNLDHNNSEGYDGIKSPTLRITIAWLSMNHYTYRCEVTGECGTEVSDTATLVVNVAPGALIDYQTFDEHVCSESTDIIYAVQQIEDNDYHWSYSGTGVIIEDNGHQVSLSFDASATSGSLRVYNFNACGDGESLEDSVTVTEKPDVSFEMVTDTICNSADSVLLSDGNPSGGIYDGDGVDRGYFHPAIAGNGAHTIYYQIDGENNCSRTDSSALFVENCTLLSVEVNRDNNDFNVYPNPFTDYLMVKLNGKQHDKVNIKIYNLLGKTIYDNEVNLINNGARLTFETSVAKGTYIISINNDNLSLIKRIVNQK